jgi:hypothetical protein
MIVVASLFGCWVIFGAIFLCVPIEYFWGIGTGSCMDRNAFWMSMAAGNIFTDVLIFAIPVTLIWRLSIPTRQKIAMGVILAFGAL